MQKSFIFPLMYKHSSFLSVIAAAFLVTGCSGWHLANSVTQEPLTVSVPYVHGDDTGQLTRKLVEEISHQPGFRIDDGGQYVLSVRLLDEKEEKLGFRYDPLKLRHDKKDLILSESRAKALAEVSLINSYTQEKVCGPAYILGNIDYDHQENTIDNDIQKFSLGQLADIDTGHDVTYVPLYRDLARKISMWLQNQQDVAACHASEPSDQ